MKTATFFLFALFLASTGLFAAADEAALRAEYDAALKAAKEAEVAISPIRTTMQKAEAAAAEAGKLADSKRKQATEAKSLATEKGIKELAEAGERLTTATKALADAANAKPPLDEALESAKSHALPLQQTYEVAEKTAQEAESLAKTAALIANKPEDELKKTTVYATAKRRAADSAKAALARLRQAKQNFLAQLEKTPGQVSEAQTKKQAAEALLGNAKTKVAAASDAYQSAEQVALAAEINAQPVSEAEAKQAAENAIARRKAADEAKESLILAWRAESQAQLQVADFEKILADAPAQKQTADEALAKAKDQLAAAAAQWQVAEETALLTESRTKAVSETEKQQAGEEVIAKRKTAEEAKAALAQAQQNEQKAQVQASAARKHLAEAPAWKKTADEAFAKAKKQLGAAKAALQSSAQSASAAEAEARLMAERAGRNEEEKKRLSEEAVARRTAANSAKAALEQVQQEQQRAQAQVSSAAKSLAEAPAQKKIADEALIQAKAQLAAAMSGFQSAEQAVLKAEAHAKTTTERVGEAPEEEIKQGKGEAAAKRKAADAAKATLGQAQQQEQQAQDRANAAAKTAMETPALKKAADEKLSQIEAAVTAATAALRSAEQAASAAEANARLVTEEEKQKAADTATAKRKEADAAKAAFTQAQQNEQQAQAQAEAAAKRLAEAPAKAKAAEDAFAIAANQLAAATVALQSANEALVCAETVVQALAERGGKSQTEKKKTAAEGSAGRRVAEAAKAALAQAQQNEQQALLQAKAAARNLAEVPARKKAAENAQAKAKQEVVAATKAYNATAGPATAAENTAKVLGERFRRSPSQKRQAAVDATSKRKLADAAKTALAEAETALADAKKLANAAAQKLTRIEAQKTQTEGALTNARNQIAEATAVAEVAEQTAQAAEKLATEKARVAAETLSKRKAVSEAEAALAQAQQTGQQVLSPGNGQKPASTGNGNPAGTNAEIQTTNEARAKAEKQIATATAALERVRESAKEIIRLDSSAKQAASVAAEKRKAAVEAKAALDPKAKAQEQAAVKASNAAQEVIRAEARKKSCEEELETLKKRVASAKQTFEADEKAALAAEAAAAPLKEEAARARATYSDSAKLVESKHALAEQAKTALYRLVSAREITKIMESAEPPRPANRIDEIVFAKLKGMGIQPVLCSDAVFVRRAYLDLTGRLPGAEEAKAFIQDRAKNKRVTMIDQLLDRTEHVDYWAMKWSDILKVKAEFPVKIWPNAAQAYYRWIWESIARNKPYDQFVRELLVSNGSNFRDGPVNFYRAIQDKTPEGIAGAVGLAVMGTRVLLWTPERRAGMAPFFSQIGYKPTGEWKEEIVFWDPLKSTDVPGSTAPGVDSIAKAVTATNLIPTELANPMAEPEPLTAVFPDGTKVIIPNTKDPREVFAEWLIRPGNRWFAQAIVNRTWAWAMGRGIIHEPDDLRENNPPSNPELLAYLEKELVASRYNLKELKRLIFTSSVYQFSSIQKSHAPEARAHFASYPLRRLEAEVLVDALNDITGGSDLYTSAVPEPFTYIPHDMTAVELADGSVTSPFLTLFGRSSRATGMETERVNELASSQWLHLLNSASIQAKIQGGPKLAAILSKGGKSDEIAEKLYLAILSRFPTDADLAAAEAYAKSGATKGNHAWMDLAWALINSPEFLLRH